MEEKQRAVERVLLRVPEAAEALGVSASQVRNLIWAGELPAVRIGRAVRVARAELAKYAEALPSVR